MYFYKLLLLSTLFNFQIIPIIPYSSNSLQSSFTSSEESNFKLSKSKDSKLMEVDGNNIASQETTLALPLSNTKDLDIIKSLNDNKASESYWELVESQATIFVTIRNNNNGTSTIIPTINSIDEEDKDTNNNNNNNILDIEQDFSESRTHLTLLPVVLVSFITITLIMILYFAYKMCNIGFANYVRTHKSSINGNPAAMTDLRSVSVGSILVPSQLLQRYNNNNSNNHHNHNNEIDSNHHVLQRVELSHSESCPSACTICSLRRTLELSTQFHPELHSHHLRHVEYIPPPPTPPPKYPGRRDPNLPSYDDLFVVESSKDKINKL